MKLGKLSNRISIIILISLVFSLTISFFLLENDKIDKSYFPPKFDGEKVIPGYFDEKN
tara:strand:+ start:361 stop:534 length:174 start_codon:yes stop_codon:yes gene_type:complete